MTLTPFRIYETMEVTLVYKPIGNFEKELDRFLTLTPYYTHIHHQYGKVTHTTKLTIVGNGDEYDKHKKDLYAFFDKNKIKWSDK